ncbi:hypothetical protein D3C71_1544400 [compost metagenome]
MNQLLVDPTTTGARRRGQKIAPTTAAQTMPRQISWARDEATSNTAMGLSTTARAIIGRV